MRDFYTAVVSSARPSSVPRMQELLAGLEPIHWHVPWSQGEAYRMAGAEGVVEVLDSGAMMLPTQRNSVLLAAQQRGQWSVQFNDDLHPSKRFPTGLNVYDPDDQSEIAVTAEAAAIALRLTMTERGARFGGIATTTNKFFVGKEGWATRSFVMAHLMVMSPDCDERFDIEMGVKEDYDFTLQHIANHGIALRANRILGNFRHAEKKGGGCSAYRSIEYERWMADRLIERWAPHVKRNPRRDGEVLIRWKNDA